MSCVGHPNVDQRWNRGIQVLGSYSSDLMDLARVLRHLFDLSEFVNKRILPHDGTLCLPCFFLRKTRDQTKERRSFNRVIFFLRMTDHEPTRRGQRIKSVIDDILKV